MGYTKGWLRIWRPARALQTVMVLVCIGLLVSWGSARAAAGKLLRVHFIDVGQADCILIQAPGGQNMLVDAGNRDDAPLIAAYLTKQGVRRLQVIIGTHPHEDHIGGMAEIIRQFDVDRVYLPKVTANTRTFADLLAAVKAKGLKVTTARAGIDVNWRTTARARFLAPNSAHYEELNNYSAVLKLTYGKRALLLTGDAETLSEREMLEQGYDLKADLLKVGHHGSNSSTGSQFLAAVAPQYAVISVGKNNDYHHPAQRTLKRLKKMGVQVYRTDLTGTVLCVSDGRKLDITISRSK